MLAACLRCSCMTRHDTTENIEDLLPFGCWFSSSLVYRRLPTTTKTTRAAGLLNVLRENNSRMLEISCKKCPMARKRTASSASAL